MRLAAQAKGGFYPTPPRVLDLLATLLRPPARLPTRYDGTVRLLDPCCGAGAALAQLASRLHPYTTLSLETYGVELHQERSVQATGCLDHTLATDLFAAAIANRAFGLLLLNPPYDHDGEQQRSEHRFLLHCTRYLAEHGVLVFIVPRRRLPVSARFLAAHYRRLACWAFPHPERAAFDQVVLTGCRRARPQPDPAAEQQIHRWAEGELRELTPAPSPPYTVPATPAGELLFSTRTVDPLAAAAEARRSGLWTHATVTDALWPPQTRAPGRCCRCAAGIWPCWWRPASWITSAWKRTASACWSRGAPPRSWCWWSAPASRRPAANGCAPRSSPSTCTPAPSPTSPPSPPVGTGPPRHAAAPVPARDRRGRILFT